MALAPKKRGGLAEEKNNPCHKPPSCGGRPTKNQQLAGKLKRQLDGGAGRARFRSGRAVRWVSLTNS
jgi:hypothetical protein